MRGGRRHVWEDEKRTCVEGGGESTSVGKEGNRTCLRGEGRGHV